MDPTYQRPRHLKLLAERLAAIERGEIRRLIVMMPPRHGKSETTTVKFPSWYLGRHPWDRVIIASHTATLAARFSMRGRNDFASFAPEIFGLEVNPEVSAMYRWDVLPPGNKSGRPPGGMIAAGVGGPITGHGAHLAVIDDPIKDAEQAQSKQQRDGIWDWYRFVLRTRLMPGAAVVLVLTRWHQDDLAGRLLKEAEADPKADQWEVLKLPALAEAADPLGREPGEALWPEQYNEDALLATKASSGSYVWQALYQQSPVDLEGGMFRREWFQIVDQAPADLKRVRYWDLAATEAKRGSDPDWTVGALLGERHGIYYVLDIQRTRSTPAGVEALVKQTAELDGREVQIYMEQEPGASGVNLIDHYAREVLKGYAFRGVRSTGSKEVRAQPLSAAAEAGNVRLVKAPWSRDLLDELEAFPRGAHDDQVDALSGALEQLTASPSDKPFLIG